MNEQELKIGEPTSPRFEFRTFGHDFTEINSKMAKLSVPIPNDLRIRIFDEIYIISKTADDINIKIKSNKLDFKKLIRSQDNLEQWNTIVKFDFPISKKLLMNRILPVLKVNIPLLKNSELNKKQFINITKKYKELLVVPVKKKRYAYIVNFTICEFAEVLIGDSYLFSVGVESTEAEKVTKTIQKLKLDSLENINYIQAIKRVNGIISKPFAN